MAPQTITFETVRKIGLEMPGVEEGTMYGSPALKFRGQMLACIPIHKSAESNSLGVYVSFDAREDLLREAPDIYYVKDHYVPYPFVLVRLSRINVGALRDLLGMSLRFVKDKARRKKTSKQ